MKRSRSILLGLGVLVCGALAAVAQAPSAVTGNAASADSNASLAASFRAAASCIFDSQAKITERLWAAHHLGRRLSRTQISELFAFLRALPSAEEKNRAGLNVLKNDLMSALQDLIQPPEGFTSSLIALYGDREQDPVARDYALQHLVTWYEQGAPDAPDAKARIEAVLRLAVREDGSIAGTALLGLHRLIAHHPGLPPRRVLGSGPWTSQGISHPRPGSDEVAGIAVRMLSAAGVPCAARITAVQVCAEREVVEALPMIEALARADASIALRISAIAALGGLGGPAEALLLRDLKAEGNQALSPAIEAALRRIQTRLLINAAISQNAL